ncbi:MAG: DNA polymerase III subunit gamma/tau [Spirochaetales bacterium]|nr:DNA polymerase III subunit gamma/tau [Spirochaetales bacterium]
MSYEVTAIRKRPQSFDELVGQDFVVATLKSSILQGRIAHAYLFSGPRGVGKTSAARILAKALNCERGPTDTPCGQCASCQAITQGNALDVIEIDGASNTSVNDVREIKDEVLFAPNSSRYKIYIIDEVHMLSNSAFNALLKTIEEPPPYIVFVFATTEVHKVPATIRSRCQQFNFRLISTEQIVTMLRRVVEEAGIPAEEAALLWVAREATGSLRDAYTLLDQVLSFSRTESGAGKDQAITLERIRDKLGLMGVEQISRIGTIISHRDKKEILEYTEEVLGGGVSIEQFVTDLTDYFRSLLFLKCGIQKPSLLSFSAQSVPAEVLDSFSTARLEKAVELLLELYRRLRYSLEPRFDLELVMCQLASLQELIEPSELLRELRTLKAQLESGEAAPEPADPSGASIGPPQEGGGGASGGEESPSQQDEHEPSAAAGPEDRFEALVEAVRKDRLALATSLGQAESWEVVDGELRLNFKERSRFSGEQVLREKDVVLRHAQKLFAEAGVSRIRVQYAGAQGASRSATGGRNQVEIVKKVFRGEIVQGE